jgi:hypothetical protein
MAKGTETVKRPLVLVPCMAVGIKMLGMVPGMRVA